MIMESKVQLYSHAYQYKKTTTNIWKYLMAKGSSLPLSDVIYIFLEVVLLLIKWLDKYPSEEE